MVLPWFDVREIAPRAWRIHEPGHVSSYLVEGRDAAALIDSGMGIASIGDACARLTDRPLEVVHTHSHFDHVGGDREFERIAVHEAGAERLAGEFPRHRLEAYLEYIAGLERAFADYRALDDAWFGLLTAEEEIRPLPDGFDPAAWRIGPAKATRLLREGDEVALGGRTLRVLHTPGHSPDSVCLWLPGERLLFAGDTINSGPIFAQLPESDVAAFTASTARLAASADEIDRVAMCHGLRAIAGAGFVREVADLFAWIAQGRVLLRPTADGFGDPVLEARSDHARVYLADPGRPRAGRLDEWPVEGATR
ncbi:MAG: hypothetical protein A2X23_12505 [Chloroflexi bacterium GWC2_73_18]|nr:MAG: hypothetical protein A2X23_12505 [Chloroflexi bacterium GWC2_73_18]